MNQISQEERARKIKLLILDVDGVMTDGRIILDNFANELKCFSVKDGLGLYLLHKAGIPAVIITAKKSRVVKRRAKQNYIRKVYYNAHDKIRAYNNVLKNFKLTDNEVCFMGDDLIDMPILKRVGLAVCVPDAADEAKALAHYITKNRGGKGAVREVIDMILKAQGRWEGLIAIYQV